MGQALQEGPVVVGLGIEGVGRHHRITAGDGPLQLLDRHGVQTIAGIGDLGLGRWCGAAGR